MRSSVLAGILALLVFPGLGRAEKPVVLFDQGHGQRFAVDQSGDLQLSELAGVFRAAGFEVRTTSGKIDRDTLGGVRALVSSGLFVPYDASEIQEILSFVERGGALSIMLHVAPTYANLLTPLGVLSSPGVLNEGENLVADDPLDFRILSFLPHPLTDGLAHFSLYGGWAVMDSGKGGQTVAFSSRQSWIDADRDRRRSPAEPLHSYGVLVAGSRGRGRYAVFGDDAIFQNRFLDAENRKLASNLAAWLRGASSI